MKKSLLIIVFALLSFCGLYAQQNQQQQPVQLLTPTVVVGDIVFVYQTLGTIEIKGSEADAFLAVQNLFKEFVQEFQTSKKKVEDTVEIKIPVAIAQNTINLLERATFTGANAERYKRFQNALVEAANKLKQKGGK